MCECASSNAIFTSVGWATLYTTTKTTNFFKSTIQCFWVYGHSVAVPPHLRERFLFSMPLSISSGCLFLAVKLKSLVLFFRQGRRSFSFLRVCLPLFMSLYLSVPPPPLSLWGFLNPLPGTVEAETETGWNTLWFQHSHSTCVLTTHSQEGSEVVLEFVSSPFDIKEWSLRWQNTQDSVGRINATLKVIPEVRYCSSTKKRQRQRDSSAGCLYGRAGGSRAQQEQDRPPVWNVYTANIR